MTTYELFKKDRQGYITAVERLRSKYDKFAANKMREAMLKQTYFARQSIEMATSTSDLLGIQISSVTIYAREAYEAIYKKVGAAFAAETYKNVKAIAQKTKEDYTLQANWERDMERFLDVYGATRIAKVAETTEKRVRDIIKQQVKLGMAKGDGIDVIKRNIMQSVNGMSATRATTIARTEVVGASNQGSLIGAQSSGLALQKMWVTAHNKIPPRPAHKDADGQKVDLTGLFDVGGEKMNAPGDPTASAENVINCRCTVVYVKK